MSDAKPETNARSEYEATVVETAEEREACFALRMRVFVEEQGVPAEEELDVYDLTATHFLVRRREPDAPEAPQIVATARLLDKGDGIGKVGRVAVLPEHRGQGVGTRLMRAVEATAHQQGFIRLVLDAQVSALPFYEKLGYTAEGGLFLDCDIEHQAMWKELA